MGEDAIKKVVQFPLWPDEKGLLQLPDESDAPRTTPLITSPLGQSGLRSRRLRPSRRERRRMRSLKQFWRSSSLWLRLSLRTGYFTHRGSSTYFAHWLREKVGESPFGAVDVADVIAAAMEELGLEREKALRYLLEQTSRNGDFRSDGEIVTLK